MLEAIFRRMINRAISLQEYSKSSEYSVRLGRLTMRWLTGEKAKKKHKPDVEFVAFFSLNACVDRLEALNGSESSTGDRLNIQVDPIDSETWVFKAKRRSLNKIIIEVRGSLLKKDDLSTMVLIKGYTGDDTTQWVNAIFVIILLVILGIMSILIAAKAFVLAFLIATLTLLPLFGWRFVDFDSQSYTDRQRLEQIIKRTLE